MHGTIVAALRQLVESHRTEFDQLLHKELEAKGLFSSSAFVSSISSLSEFTLDTIDNEPADENAELAEVLALHGEEDET